MGDLKKREKAWYCSRMAPFVSGGMFFFCVFTPNAPAENYNLIYDVTSGATHVRHCPLSDANEAFISLSAREEPQLH